MCRECFPGPASQPASLLPHVHGFPALRVLPASPTSIVASVSLRLIHSVDILGPFSSDQDGGGSPRCHDASVSVHAVLLDPAGVSDDHRPLRSPTFAFQIFDPVGLRVCHEAQSLHLRYGRTSLCLRLTHVVAFMSPRLDSRWDGSFPFRGGNLTR